MARFKLNDKAIVANGCLTKEVKFDAGSVVLPIGSRLDIARIIRTPAGLSYRIATTLYWLREDEVSTQHCPSKVFDYTGTHAEEQVPESWTKTSTISRERIRNIGPNHNSNIQLKTRNTSVINKHNPKRMLTRGKKMDKQELRKVLQGLNQGDVVKVAFLGTKAEQSGEYTVLRTKTGRGKGGSLLVELAPTHGSGPTVVTGTPDSAELLHLVTPDGTLHGYSSAEDVPPVFEINSVNAALYRDAFKRLLDAKERLDAGRPYRVSLTSVQPEYQGEFLVSSAVQKRGRYGQTVLTLSRPGQSQTLELWSFRHSGVVCSFELVSER